MPRPHHPVVLLGPQQPTSDVGAVLAELGIRGRVAMVRAGYQERESDDGELVAALGVPAVNLRLHARAVEVFAGDPEFTKAYQARQLHLRNVQSCYRVRLDKTDDAARTIAVRYFDPALLDEEDAVSVAQFRHLDANHLDRCQAVRVAFAERWRFGTRPLIARHRAELKAELQGAEALIIAGGHVASLLNRLELFDVLALAAGKPVIAWSAGAMALTDRIVLFHDFPPYGSDIAQILDAGLGLAPGIVVLPDPRRRVRLDDRAGIARFARRMASATCVAMDAGTRVVFERGRLIRASAARLTTSGEIEARWTGAPP
jgi:hypothetical protein